MKEFFDRTFIGTNTVADWFWFCGIILLGLLASTVVAKLLTKFIFRFFYRRDSERVGFPKLFELVRKPWHLFLLLISVFIAAQKLTWPVEWNMTAPDQFGIRMVLERLLLCGIELSFMWVLLRITDFFGLLLHTRAVIAHGNSEDQLVLFLRESIKVVIFIFSIFFILGSVFHVNVASLIAGLGIGGIAIALAAKESLENLIASFTIFLDKPFVIGDFVEVSGQKGTIEKIGFRSTRIRSEDRNFVTMPNRKMVENEVINLSRRTARRIRTIVSLLSSTSPDQLRNIMSDISKTLEAHPHLSKGESRVNFFETSPGSLDIQVLYYIPELDFDLFLKTKEEINFAITDAVRKHGAGFAQTISIVNSKI